MAERQLAIHSLSTAEDLGYLALRDLEAAAAGMDYRVVGGHMVLLLLHVYPTARAVRRTTADADAAVDRVQAAGGELHQALTDADYRPVAGNSYERDLGGDRKVSIDLLVDGQDRHTTVTVGGRNFDAVPGLSLALVAPPLLIRADVTLHSGESLRFTAPVPDVEAALVAKAAAWGSRGTAKDAHDIATLLEIAHEHRGGALQDWKLHDPETAGRGSRLDACRALYRLLGQLNRKQVPPGVDGPRLAALIQRHTARPPRA